LGDLLLRNPTTGIAGCCARAASGHAAAPPSSVMNSRRLMSPPALRRDNVFKCFPTFEHDASQREHVIADVIRL